MSCDAHLLAPRRAPQPCDRTHTHATLRRRRSATDCAAHAAPFIPHPAPALPHKLHTTQSAPGCVAHTQWVPARCTGGRGGTGGGRHAFSSQRPHGRRFSSGTACPHTASQLHMAHPAPHTTLSRDMHAARTREATSVGLRCAFLHRRSTHAWTHTPTHTEMRTRHTYPRSLIGERRVHSLVRGENERRARLPAVVAASDAGCLGRAITFRSSTEHLYIGSMCRSVESCSESISGKRQHI